MFPRTSAGTVVDFSSTFPTSFDGDWKKCNEMCYIPVNIRYNKNLGEYIYYFPKSSAFTNNTIIFRLYEPRINNLT